MQNWSFEVQKEWGLGRNIPNDIQSSDIFSWTIEKIEMNLSCVYSWTVLQYSCRYWTSIFQTLFLAKDCAKSRFQEIASHIFAYFQIRKWWMQLLLLWRFPYFPQWTTKTCWRQGWYKSHGCCWGFGGKTTIVHNH